MRVLEADPSILYKMGKNKKHKIRKAKENDLDESSDDAQMSGCSHITKAVNINTLRKGITKSAVSIDECTGCVKEGTKSVTKDLFGGVVEGTAPVTDGEEAENIIETTICVCLQCGHQGCDRNSHNKHALKHYKTPHTGLHCIIVNLTTWSTWCYMCDDEVTVTPRVQGCIEFLQKTCGFRPNRPDTALSATTKANEAAMAEATSSYVNSPAAKPSTAVSCAKVKGLSNLGNTCFFNAVMQSMCQTRGLENLLMERSKQEKMTVLGPFPGDDSDSNSSEDERDEDFDKMKPMPTIQTMGGEPGPVTQALLGFMQEMRGGSKNGVVNPTVLFTQVCKKAPRFKGFQQQDSHELLRYLIDSVRTEEIRKGQCSILKFFKLSETINPKRVDDETKLKIKQYGRQVKHTFVDSVFGGQLVSTVKCEECKNVSQIYEAFLDLSLPVMEEKPQRPFITLIGKKKDSMVLNDDGDVVAASNMGLDSCHDKPSKYQDKKNKRNAKKDAKKKVKSQVKSKTLSLSQFVNQDEGNEKGSGDQDNASEDSSSKAADGNDSCEGGKLGNGMVVDSTRAKNGDVQIEDDEVSARNSSPEGSKEGLDTNRDDGSSSKDDPSDADIEDNLEGDPSRVVVSLQNGSGCRQSGKWDSTSHEVTLSLPNEGLSQSQSSDVKEGNVKDSKDVDVLVEKVERIRLQENDNIKSDENLQDSNVVKCDMFTVDTTVNNYCNTDDSLQQNNGECILKEETVTCDNDKDIKTATIDKEENSSSPLSSSLTNNNNTNTTNTTTTTTNSEKDLPPASKTAEVTAVFSISLPDAASSQTVSIGGDNGLGLNSSTTSQNSVKTDPSSLSSSLKWKGESGGDAADQQLQYQEDRKCLVDDKTMTMSAPLLNGTKPRSEYLREAKQYSMNTLAPRYHAAPKECSVLSCLNQFTAAELLTGSNKVGCKSCTKNKLKNALPQKAEKKGKDTVYSNANKQYLIFRPPAVLTLHLKRFEQTGLTSRKVNRHVDFPLTLDLAPYCSSLCSNVKDGQGKVLYSLYGIVEHSGRLNGGHYTAYVKLRPGVVSHTQFLNTQPHGPQDILNIYMERILKMKNHQSDGSEAVDKDIEARAECLAAPGRWFHISDSRVNEVTEACVMKAQAYLLFYERIF